MERDTFKSRTVDTWGQWVPSKTLPNPPHHFLDQKVFFLLKIGGDEREGVDKKSHKNEHRKESVQPYRDVPHINSYM